MEDDFLFAKRLYRELNGEDPVPVVPSASTQNDHLIAKQLHQELNNEDPEQVFPVQPPQDDYTIALELHKLLNGEESDEALRVQREANALTRKRTNNCGSAVPEHDLHKPLKIARVHPLEVKPVTQQTELPSATQPGPSRMNVPPSATQPGPSKVAVAAAVSQPGPPTVSDNGSGSRRTMTQVSTLTPAVLEKDLQKPLKIPRVHHVNVEPVAQQTKLPKAPQPVPLKISVPAAQAQPDPSNADHGSGSHRTMTQVSILTQKNRIQVEMENRNEIISVIVEKPASTSRSEETICLIEETSYEAGPSSSSKTTTASNAKLTSTPPPKRPKKKRACTSPPKAVSRQKGSSTAKSQSSGATKDASTSKTTGRLLRARKPANTTKKSYNIPARATLRSQVGIGGNVAAMKIPVKQEKDETDSDSAHGSKLSSSQLHSIIPKRASAEDFLIPALHGYIKSESLHNWRFVNVNPDVQMISERLRSRFFRDVVGVAQYTAEWVAFKDQTNFKIDLESKIIEFNTKTLQKCSRGRLLGVVIHALIHCTVYATSPGSNKQIEEHDESFKKILKTFNKKWDLAIGTDHTFLCAEDEKPLFMYVDREARKPFFGIVRCNEDDLPESAGKRHKIFEATRQFNNNSEVRFLINIDVENPQPLPEIGAHSATQLMPRELVDITDDNEEGFKVQLLTQVVELDDQPDNFSRETSKVVETFLSLSESVFNSCPICDNHLKKRESLREHLEICFGAV